MDRDELGRFVRGIIPWNKGVPHTKKSKQRMSEARKGIRYSPATEFKKGQKHGPMPEEVKRKIGRANKGNKYALGSKRSEEHKKRISIANSGPNNSCWKGGCQKNERNDYAYKQWVRKVKLRDKQTCRINDENCSGYNIVHHIFSWRKYPKLRYELTNGITLCQAHHPRGRAKEELFRKLFSYLVKQK